MTRYDVLINPRREDRRRLGGLREVKFQVDTGDPRAQQHYGENAEQIGAAIAADYPDSIIIVESTDDLQDVCRRGYVIDSGEGGSLDDDANGWPPTWFVHRAMEEGLNGRDFEEYLIDLLPEGWGYHIAEDRALTFRLRCPHGHVVEPLDPCQDGCVNPLAEWLRKSESKPPPGPSRNLTSPLPLDRFLPTDQDPEDPDPSFASPQRPTTKPSTPPSPKTPGKKAPYITPDGKVNLLAFGPDWPKQTLDFEGTNADELRAELAAMGETVDHFKTLDAYKLALRSGKYPWLADL